MWKHLRVRGLLAADRLIWSRINSAISSRASNVRRAESRVCMCIVERVNRSRMRETSSLSRSQSSIARRVRDLQRRVSRPRDHTFPRIRRWTRELLPERISGPGTTRARRPRVGQLAVRFAWIASTSADTILDYFRSAVRLCAVKGGRMCSAQPWGKKIDRRPHLRPIRASERAPTSSPKPAPIQPKVLNGNARYIQVRIGPRATPNVA